MKLRWFLPAVVLGMSGCGYNRIQELDERAARAKQDIKVQLQRRADLIGNLVETVKGYAAHEEEVFTNVANARARLAGATAVPDPSAGELAAANEQLTGALSRLLVISERYPELKADQQFLRLQDELVGTENRIAVARTDYNEAANQYNTYIRRFPAAMTAKVTGAKTREYFDVTDPASLEAPKVDFSKEPGKSPPP
jgi:LemA protein